MAVIGARPVTGIGVLGRRVRPRPRPRPVSTRVRSGVRSGALRRPRQVAGISTFLVTIAVAAALALFYLSQSSHVAATGYQIDALQSQLGQLSREQQQLVLRIGEARSPARIETQARSRLHLAPLDQELVTFAAPFDADAHATH